jgi:L-cystine transport system ATP-binding protein
MKIIEVSGLRRAFGEREVLKGIDLSVRKGEVVALLGPSGSGKTTLLRCLNFLEKADAGILRIEDETADLRKVKSKQMLSMRRKTAMVFQNYDLFLNKTVLENVTEGLVIARKVDKDEAKERAVNVLQKVGLADRLDSRPYQLSGGQQQRVGIARALAVEPAVVLFDEPTSALDPEKVDEILEVIRDVAEAGITMIVVTHEMAFAYEVAGKVVFMEDGVVVEQGPPKQVFGSPREERTKQFLARFTGSKSPEYFI